MNSYLCQIVLSFSALLFMCINHDSAVVGLSQRFVIPQARRYRHVHGRTALSAKRNWSPNPTPPPPNPIDSQPESDVQSEGLKYTLELPKAMGVNWGSDLSFRWIFVNSLDESGAAAASGAVKKVRCNEKGYSGQLIDLAISNPFIVFCVAGRRDYRRR